MRNLTCDGYALAPILLLLVTFATTHTFHSAARSKQQSSGMTLATRAARIVTVFRATMERGTVIVRDV